MNGAWRQVVIDALLPKSKSTSLPLHATTLPIQPSRASETSIGPPWIPLAIKAYFKALGGYTIRGSDPGPDIHAFTGWIPERLSLREGFQREKEWKRVQASWARGEVLVTLGTGKTVRGDLVAYHAYGVISLEETQDGERVLEIVDPGSTPRQSHGVLEESMDRLSLSNQQGDLSLLRLSRMSFRMLNHIGSFMMSWDQVCGEFEMISLNWDPALFPNTAKRLWYVWRQVLPDILMTRCRSWPKPRASEDAQQSGSLGESQVVTLLAEASADQLRHEPQIPSESAWRAA